MSERELKWIELITFMLVATEEETDGFYGYIGMNRELAGKIICILADLNCFYLLGDFIEKFKCDKYFLC